MAQSYRDLVAWQKAMVLARTTYSATEAFPRREIFGLASQMRRAAVSIPSNIAEGKARVSTRDFVRFLRTAKASLAELETQVILSAEVGYLARAVAEELLQLSDEVSRILAGLIASMAPDDAGDAAHA